MGFSPGGAPENIKFFIVVTLFAAQFASMVFGLGKQTEAIDSKLVLVNMQLDVIGKKLQKTDADRDILMAVVKDIAILQAKDNELERRLATARK